MSFFLFGTNVVSNNMQLFKNSKTVFARFVRIFVRYTYNVNLCCCWLMQNTFESACPSLVSLHFVVTCIMLEAEPSQMGVGEHLTARCFPLSLLLSDTSSCRVHTPHSGLRSIDALPGVSHHLVAQSRGLQEHTDCIVIHGCLECWSTAVCFPVGSILIY